MPTKFVYRRSSAKEIQNRATQTGSMYDRIIQSNFATFSPKKGVNAIRFLPATFANSEHYSMPIFIHRNCGPDRQSYLCLDRMKEADCPVCEARLEFLDDDDKEAADEIRVQPSRVAWIIDRDNERDGPKVWTFGVKMDKAINALCVDGRTGEILYIDHPENGYDVEFTREGEGLRSTYIGQKIARKESYLSDSEADQDKWLEFIENNPLDKVLNFYSYEHMKKACAGRSNTAEDKALDPKDEPTPSRRSSIREEIDDHIPERGAEAEKADSKEPPFEGGRRRREAEPDTNIEKEEPRSRRSREPDPGDKGNPEKEEPRRRARSGDTEYDKDTGEVIEERPRRTRLPESSAEAEEAPERSRRGSEAPTPSEQAQDRVSRLERRRREA